ncbi:MAG: class I SAM-dependent methyltransferase [Myxococcota bacterium]
MSSRALAMSEALHQYVIGSSVPPNPLLERLREETAQLEWGRMQISPDQGQLMGLLVKLMGARRCLEIGTFTGYSALAVALAMPDDGRVVCCDISEAYTTIARRYWDEAGVRHKIDLRLAPALETLQTLDGPFDFVFLDADKVEYPQYFEACLALVRPGGLITIDNVFMGGGRPRRRS